MAEMIFVIGSGRSGTSLAAQMLGKLGGRISDELVPVGEQNPDGAYEDKFVFESISKLMRELGATHNLPMPQGWLETPAARICINELVEKVSAELQRGGAPWVLKEPRSALLIPLWRKVFNRTKVAPKYILALRNPKNVCESSFKQYGEPVEVTELMWLNKNVSALSELGGSSYLLHYESWFANPTETARGLADFAGLPLDEPTLQAIVGETVKPRLNRSDFLDIELKNPCVANLYQALQACNGLDYERDQVKGALQQAMEAMDAFSGWVQLYHTKKFPSKPVGVAKKDKESQESQRQEIILLEQAKQDLAEALLRESQLLGQLESGRSSQQSLDVVATKLLEVTRAEEKAQQALVGKKEKMEAFRARLDGLQKQIAQKNERIAREEAHAKTQRARIDQLINSNKVLKKRDAAILASTSFQLGLVFAHMIRSPLKGFFLLPANIFSVLKKRRARGK